MQLLNDRSTRVTEHSDNGPPSTSNSCCGWRSSTTTTDLVKSTAAELGGNKSKRVGLGYFRGLAASLNRLVSLTVVELAEDAAPR
nr:hypothetical protein Iba_chr03aCG9760 [Ipomoea batatas]